MNYSRIPHFKSYDVVMSLYNIIIRGLVWTARLISSVSAPFLSLPGMDTTLLLLQLSHKYCCLSLFIFAHLDMCAERVFLVLFTNSSFASDLITAQCGPIIGAVP